GLATPEALVVTLYVPDVLLAVNADAGALPLALVFAVVGFVDVFANVPDAPELGAVNVTVALGTGFAYSSMMFTWNAVAKAELSAATWLLPPTMLIVSLDVLALTATERPVPLLMDPSLTTTLAVSAL